MRVRHKRTSVEALGILTVGMDSTGSSTAGTDDTISRSRRVHKADGGSFGCNPVRARGTKNSSRVDGLICKWVRSSGEEENID